MFKIYPDFFGLVREVLKDRIHDYINGKRAQLRLWKYDKKDNFCTACGIVNESELEALIIVSEQENIQKNKKEMMIRLGKFKEDSFMTWHLVRY